MGGGLNLEDKENENMKFFLEEIHDESCKKEIKEQITKLSEIKDIE